MSIGEQIETIVNSMTGNNNPPQVVKIRKGYDNNTADVITKNGILKNVKCSGEATAGDEALLVYDNGDMQTPFLLLFHTSGGGGGDVDIDTSFPSTPSDTHVPSTKLTKTELDKKINKSSTVGLVKNDGSIDTKNYQETLSSGVNIKTINNNSLLGSGNIDIQGGGSVDIVTSWGHPTSDEKVPSEKLTKLSLNDKVDRSELHNLDINLTTIELVDIEDNPNGVICFEDLQNDYQEKLVSGTNIKTINNTSLLGSGNIDIQGGGGSVIGTGSFSINSNGHLIVELPNAVDNPYFINNNGHLIYDTTNTHNGE